MEIFSPEVLQPQEPELPISSRIHIYCLNSPYGRSIATCAPTKLSLFLRPHEGEGGDCSNLGPYYSSPTAVPHSILCSYPWVKKNKRTHSEKCHSLYARHCAGSCNVPHGYLTLDQPALKDGGGQKRGRADFLTVCILIHTLEFRKHRRKGTRMCSEAMGGGA